MLKNTNSVFNNNERVCTKNGKYFDLNLQILDKATVKNLIK